MIARSETRAFVCVLILLSLCAPILAIAARAANRDRAIELRTLGPLSSTVLLTRAVAGYVHARHRPAAPTLFTIVPADTASDPGHLAAGVESRLTRSLWIAGSRTGRSPPIS